MDGQHPNYLNLHGIDPSRIEPARIDRAPGFDSVRAGQGVKKLIPLGKMTAEWAGADYMVRRDGVPIGRLEKPAGQREWVYEGSLGINISELDTWYRVVEDVMDALSIWFGVLNEGMRTTENTEGTEAEVEKHG